MKDFERMRDPEVQEKLKSCDTAADLVALAKEEGVEMTDDQLEQIAGGIWSNPTSCPECGSTNIDHVGGMWWCNVCHHKWQPV